MTSQNEGDKQGQREDDSLVESDSIQAARVATINWVHSHVADTTSPKLDLPLTMLLGACWM